MVLADSAGRPLYIYSADGSGATASGCTGGLRIRVAAVELERDPDRRAGRDRDAGQALLGQVTWNGHPLYTLASDSPGGNTTGNGVSGFHLAVASGSTAPATTTTTKASSGYRY
jgi:predicted lipoprotein with Yx(FWY)xxD motif